MPESTTSLPLQFIQALDFGKQSRAGALGLLAYDHFITLDAEVEYIWRQSKRTWSFWVYIFNRFFPIIWLTIDTIPLAPGGIASSTVCIIYLSADDIVTLLVTISVQVILQMRVYALYGLNKKLRYILLVCCIAEIIAMAVLVGVTMAHISRLNTVSTPTGCHYFGIISISALFWVPALVFEPVLLVLVIWKAWGDDLVRLVRRPEIIDKDMDQAETPLMVKSMARDSLIYFIGTYTVLMVNTIIWARFNEYINIIMPWSCTLPSILGSRIFLHMRELVLGKADYDTLGIGTYQPSPAALTSGQQPSQQTWASHSVGDIEMAHLDSPVAY